MKHLDFFRSEKNEKVYLFIGEEEYIKEKAFIDLKAHLLKDGNEEFNYSVLKEDCTLMDIYENSQQLPFLSDKRLLLVKEPKLLDKEIEDLELLKSILMDTHESNVIVFYVKSMDKRKKAYKLFRDYTTIVEFNALDEFEALRWVVSAFKKRGKVIKQDVATTLVDMVGVSVLSLSQEVEKMCDYLKDETNVDSSALKVVKSTNVNFDVFGMIKAFVAGQNQEGTDKLYALGKKGVSTFEVLGAVSHKFKNYLVAKQCLKTMSKSETISYMGGNYGLKYTVNEADKLSFSYIQKAIEVLCYTDMAVKNGIMKEDAALEYAVNEIFINNK